MVFVTGITGLTGRFLYNKLKDNNIEFIALIRESSDINWVKNKERFKFTYGDVTKPGSFEKELKNVDSIIHLVNIRYAPTIISLCRKYNIERLIIISTTGKYSNYRKYAKKYQELEEMIINSGLDYTIIRPTMIYGNKMDKNIHKLVKLLNKLPVFPILGSGENLMQPVYAKDLAESILQAYINNITIKESYNISGAYPITFNQMILDIKNTLNKKSLVLHVPKSISLTIGRIGEIIPNNLITYERVERLFEDKDFEHRKATEHFGYNPIPFEEGIKLEIESLKRENVI